MLLVLALGSFIFGFARAVAGEIPRLDPAYQERLEKNGYIYATIGGGRRTLAVLRGSQSRVLVRSEQIADVMKLAIVAVEDRRFFEHDGVDLRGVARALWADIRQRAVVQGGSTITQQFIKNVYVKNQPTLARKLREAALAWQLERRPGWPKERILTAYLNTIYFGNGAYGIDQAAQTYFQHGPSKLTLPEAALLAGLPQDPARYDPVTNAASARARRNLVLRAMLAQHDISWHDYRRARKAPLPRPSDVRLPGIAGPAPYFVNYVKQELIGKYGSSQVFGRGYRVYTSIDLELQQVARRAVARWLANPNGPTAALVAIEPRSGRVLAMYGGNNYRRSQFNLAVQGQRQPGSSFKPFVLATALAQGISPTATFPSKPVTIQADERLWLVKNYENAYLGTANLETATAQSDNAVYAQLTDLVGPRAVVRTAHSLGITSPLRPYFAIGLGAEAVNPLEMAHAFASFATGGKRVDGRVFKQRPRAILAVANKRDRVFDDNRVRVREALEPDVAARLTDLLEGVIRSGTGRRAALADGRDAAGKTGTTENYGDAWFVGYTPQLAVAVWVGYPDRLRPMLTEFQGDPVAGGTYPALIWKTFMEAALRKIPNPEPESFPPPPPFFASTRAVVLRGGSLALDNGYCRDTQLVAFVAGSEPARTADCKPNEVDVPRVIGLTAVQARERLAAQPLRSFAVYRPAKPGERAGRVVAQRPGGGTLSSYDKVTVVVTKALNGVVPRVVGLRAAQAHRRLQRLGLEVRVRTRPGKRAGRVLAQSPAAGVASARGMRVTIVVTAG